MSFIARNINTNEVLYSKGANKLTKIIGCSPSTITLFFKKEENQRVDKHIKGYIVSKTVDLTNKDRGNDPKFFV